jgi:adenylate kinase
MINAPEWSYRVLTNLKMKASDAFKDGELSPEQDESLEDEEKEELLKQLKFPWHCEKGIIGNMQKLNNEFNEFRGLNPVKIFVTGPPASGKTFYSQKLAQYYNIPHVSVKQLSDEALRISLLEEEAIGENAFWLEIKTKCDECRAKMTEEIETKRGDPPDGEEWPEINQATLPIRVPGDIIHKLLRQELVKNACRNRGYILDGYPRTFEDAQHCFLNKPIKYDEETGDVIDEEEEELEEGQKKNFDGYLVDQAIVPKSCIVLTGNDADLTKRVKHLPESAIKGTHYTAQDMQRRLKAYRTANNSQVAEYSVSDFFEQQGISLFKKSCTTETNKALDAFKIYIERVRNLFLFNNCLCRIERKTV